MIEELWGTKLEPTDFKIDNKGLLDKVKHFGHNSKTKHLDIKAKKLRELLGNKAISVTLVKSIDMVADCLTKACSRASLNNFLHSFAQGPHTE